MFLLIFGLALFLGVHLIGVATPNLRESLIQRFGENRFKLSYSIVSLGSLVLVVLGYGAARTSEANFLIWSPPTGLAHASLLLMLISFLILPAAYVPNTHILEKVRHPMTLAVLIWAFAHLLANGDLASMVLFGAFLGWAHWVYVPRYRQVKGQTLVENPAWSKDITALAIGFAAYVAFVLFLHEWLIGVAPVG